jgi:hypothetical protein
MKDKNNDERPAGPSLFLLFSLVFLALAAATAIAMTIVYPFYIRR